MKILVAPDKFKGSLSAQEVCQAIEDGLKNAKKPIETTSHPMADGGDGSLAVLADHLQLKVQNTITTDPLGREIPASYFTFSDAAFIELASASGLVLLTEKERNPLATSSFGTGKMMADAISKGYQQIYLFLGGSATNDAGIGIASALGWQFLNKSRKVLPPIGESLPSIHFIKQSHFFDLEKIDVTLLCDVTNPLYGLMGAAHVYARQKGATKEQVKYLDTALQHFSSIIQKQCGIDISNLSGGGAAGGIGAGLAALLGAKLENGFASISKLTGLEEKIRIADWVITGEGKSDAQSLQGKVVSGVAALCKKHGKPLTLFVGKNDLTEPEVLHLGASHVYSIADHAKDLEDAMSNGAFYLERMAVQFWQRLTGKV